ncbi:Holliday junction ATP-dependent DNA helicase RuvA [Planctomycetes bacterium Poly30]|uniref:Holliday junction branch migration complex subunit RuvA n=1 Tax=Saltatorellus ferox TaxID=2528018 RepID=A0A518ESD9_9BACT|nr:Holliday junction ATP-dependent DNA helicase RuvA [Planctomycetes bacterium Poly30]
MYEFISGEVADRTGTAVILDVGGVGYELIAPLGAAFPAKGSRAKVFTHFSVREDHQTLYGFPRREDRDLFRILLRVRGVGPSMALGILSGLSADDLTRAVVQEDLKALTRIKGVGKKTGEQILLDLRDKTALLAAVSGDMATVVTTTPDAPTTSSNVADAVTALISIGYSEKEAAKSVEKAAKDVGEEDLEALVRAAMRA